MGTQPWRVNNEVAGPTPLKRKGSGGDHPQNVAALISHFPQGKVQSER